MKRMIFTLAMILAAHLSLMANPAYPGKIAYRQPDGSVVYVRMHGDEWFHYTTDESGRCVELGEDGFLHAAVKPSRAEYEEAMVQRRRTQAPAKDWTPRTALTIGEHRVPVFLVQFKDRSFKDSDPKTVFSNLLNQRGYSYNGATGSVKDYYEDNSGGQYKPTFDVYGPVTLSGNVADYGGTNYGSKCAPAFFEVCKSVDNDGDIDFSQYDSDNDGVVDMILFYFAGYNQADGGRVYNVNTIWPHQSYLSGRVSEARTKRFDGVLLDRYFCTSEFQGVDGEVRCGIGTTCHEYAHSLGLPDFYDTDYEDNGEAGGLYKFSVMCSGGRNNNENTPPNMNYIERQMLGWESGRAEEITAKGNYSLSALEARTLSTSTENEFFMLESRTKTGWDSYIPYGGLLVYHVDQSSRSISYKVYTSEDNYYTYTRTAATMWERWDSYNKINAVGDHPLFYLVPAASPSSLNYSNQTKIPFPGAGGVKTWLPTDWEGEGGRFMLQNIAYSGSVSTFSVVSGAVPGVYGKVMDSSARPIKGATVTLFSASPKVSLASSVTDIDGSFNFSLEDKDPGTYVLETSCSGYVGESVEIDLPRKAIEHNVYLLAQGETLSGELRRYPNSGSAGYTGYSTENMAAAMFFSAEEMGVFRGKQLKTISFQTNASYNGTSQQGEFYVFVEVGGVRKFTQKVENPNLGSKITVNVVGQEFIIDEPGDTYIGYGIVGSSYNNALYIMKCDAANVGYVAPSFSTSSACSWTSLYFSSSGTYYTPVISATVGEPIAPDLGFHCISNPGNGVYSAGDRFNFELVQSSYDKAPTSVKWYYDGALTNASSVSLTAGKHEIKALLQHSSGTTTLSLTIQVN